MMDNNFSSIERRHDNSTFARQLEQLAEKETITAKIDMRIDDRIANMSTNDVRDVFDFSELQAAAIVAAIHENDWCQVGLLIQAAAKRWASLLATREIERDPS
jgi:hypothetical protein